MSTSSEALLAGWGRTAPSRAEVIAADPDAIRQALAEPGARGVLARGLGRSYGDAAQNAGGRVLMMEGLSGVHDVDLENGVVTVDAGVSIETLTKRLVPLGLFVHVTPGTWHVTVGGAIAADVHGKNHHADGSFCDHVLSIELMTADGELRTVEPGDELFHATAGGMGLTGVMLRATLRMLRVPSPWMTVDRERATDLDDVMARMSARDDEYRYSVAWIDCLARGRRLGRSVLIRGDHGAGNGVLEDVRNGGVRLSAPAWVPGGLLRPSTIRAFNEAYYRRAPREERARPEGLREFFYPLDAVGGWNKIYGPSGFLQYQLVVPYGAEDALRTAIERLSAAGTPSFLAVLKRFGEQRTGMISFPMKGWTLALDVPAAVPGLTPLLDGLDELVAEAGGRVYLAKDSRLRPDALAAMYGRLGEWRAARERVDPRGTMRSDLARRLELV